MKERAWMTFIIVTIIILLFLMFAFVRIAGYTIYIPDINAISKDIL